MSRPQSSIKVARTPKYCTECRGMMFKGERYLCFMGGFLPPNPLHLDCALGKKLPNGELTYWCPALDAEAAARKKKKR